MPIQGMWVLVPSLDEGIGQNRFLTPYTCLHIVYVLPKSIYCYILKVTEVKWEVTHKTHEACIKRESHGMVWGVGYIHISVTVFIKSCWDNDLKQHPSPIESPDCNPNSPPSFFITLGKTFHICKIYLRLFNHHDLPPKNALHQVLLNLFRLWLGLWYWWLWYWWYLILIL